MLTQSIWIFSCLQLDLHKGEDTHGNFPSNVKETMEGLGATSCSFTKPYTTDSTHLFGHSQKSIHADHGSELSCGVPI